MELLFKREQTSGRAGRVNFKLWGNLELTTDEKALIQRYHFNEAVLIGVIQPTLFRDAAYVGLGVFLVSAALLLNFFEAGLTFALGLIAGGIATYMWINEKRETIMVQDLIWGRHFTCKSVVDLAKKEAWLESACAVFRQVMESAKHWDGVERHSIEPLPKEQAKELILRAA